jgi:hypothetical protein
VLFEKLLAGDRAVRIGDLTENCQVEGANPRTVTVAPGASTRASLTVVCDVAGNLRIEVTTSGAEFDPDGYEVSLDGGVPVRLQRNGSYSFTEVSVGRHLVEIGDLADNCSLSGGTRRREVTVGSEGLEVVRYAVVCRPTTDRETGTLMVKPLTKGVNVDPDGYTIYLDDSESRSVPPTGTAVFEGVTAGEHEVRIDGIAENCLLWGKPTRKADVPAGGLDVIRFNLTCR